MKTAASLLLLTLVLAGCTTAPKKPIPKTATVPEKMTQQVSDAAVTPLNDLNIVRSGIPPILLEARKGPYRLPPDAGCAALFAEVTALDEALGADIDAPKAEKKDPTLLERGTATAEDVAMDMAAGMVRSTTDGVVPFRSWVRKLTGAERYSKDVASAISAGIHRRAFLKGVAAGTGCQPPLLGM